MDPAAVLLLKLLLVVCLPGSYQGECGGPVRPIFAAAQVVLLKSLDEREARKAAELAAAKLS